MGMGSSEFKVFRNPSYKRPFDLAVLLIANLVLLPVWVLVWIATILAIWIEDGRPIFYFQERVGKNERLFKVLKFRSMIDNAEEMTGPIWAAESDHRVTKVGRFLRGTALDELPQLINILKGDMSFVGPRAERPDLIRKFEKDVPGFSLRLGVRPGLTGLAQVYGKYDLHPRQKLRYDLLYLKKMSVGLDLKLLFLSVWVSLSRRWEIRTKKFS